MANLADQAARRGQAPWAAIRDWPELDDGHAVHAAVGSFRPEMQEFDADAVSRSHVFVDSVEACLEEAGELIAALAGGVTNRDSWTELGAVLEGGAPGRSDSEEITLFKSVGLAPQDACAAAAALEAAVAAGLGRAVDLS